MTSLSGFVHVMRSRKGVREGNLALFRSRAETLKALALAAEYRDYDTAKHTERVGESFALLAQAWASPRARSR